MNKFNSAWLLRKKQFRSLTGVDVAAFDTMIERLRPHWQKRIVEPKNRAGRPWGVGGLEDHLLQQRLGFFHPFVSLLGGADAAGDAADGSAVK